MKNLRDKTGAELLVLYRDVAVAIANYVASDEIMERYDLTDAQLKRLQGNQQFQEALLEAQRAKEAAALEAGIITQEHLLRESAASLQTLVTIRDLHTPGVEVEGIPEHQRPEKRDHWLASRISQDLLSRGGFGQVSRVENEHIIRIDRETSAALVNVLRESPEKREIIQITRADIAEGKHDPKILSLNAAKEEPDAEGVEHQ